MREADDLARLAAKGALAIPRQLSWRRAATLKARGWATLTMFVNRWAATATITPAGRAALKSVGAEGERKGSGMADHPEATNTVEVGRITIPGVHTIVFLAPPGEHAAVRSRRWWSRVFVVPEEALRQAARDWGAP